MTEAVTASPGSNGEALKPFCKPAADPMLTAALQA
jgi:hypothetical protein